jgi:hypothetical protein
MIIRAVQLRISTKSGPYGFSFSFSPNLTVVRGNNSSGKSTFFNTLLYALGMEEIIGGRGEKVLPYAVRDFFDAPDGRIDVVSSEIFIEIQNGLGDVITLRRPIRDQDRDTRLVEISKLPVLSSGVEFECHVPTYLHDAGSAQRNVGYFKYLEDFLGLCLPSVATTGGGEAKLYLQTIFAAHAVEQKRGWTDYIANIPFFGIRDVRTRVAEYILDLGVFETISRRNRLNAQSSAIDQDWRSAAEQLRREASTMGFVVNGVPVSPKSDFDSGTVNISRQDDSGIRSLDDQLSRLANEHAALTSQGNKSHESASEALLAQLSAAETEVRSLSAAYDRATANLALQRASLGEYEDLLSEAIADLDKNRAAQKLQKLGADLALDLAVGVCPTCLQPVQDTLLRDSVSGPQMDLETNIAYLDSQRRMLERQIAGVKEDVSRSEATITGLARLLNSKRDYATSLRLDMGSSANQSKAAIRRQVQIEVEIESLQRLKGSASQYLDSLTGIATKLAENQRARRELPPRQYTDTDENKISVFEKNFRANAGSFGYESVSDIGEIEISRDTLVPALRQIELRQINADIRADSSASDFVRLIWSYLLGLYQTSSNSHTPGNHLGVMLFDEPGQHSMRWESQRELLARLADERGLQSIVAASFDESETVFNDVTESINHKLISWEGKLIKPLEG